ncbi:MAG: 50S ribosomal protein L23 [Candidatus Giovannonibacteria bacterium GW2011_GWA1_43_15]|uniref:Large ribosomal subunit protein uL23 n=2 Tax=Candidatus Giovannoniibacteriota TaxID=1752738 RepID=A0A0G1IX33_9BACT|nr:MAG: 50S ribosomal protein L23 [Candidatus Giovannonibacteria bacterium GW2011_GWB1_43_13]KKS99847.1 MAG: 50S ribosomal protein L23 [Candidatus Giovannonibacteria bacterium GW2011_GWA1_43_15]KKT21031.1 MAG: 50S ribosomal protein L23 [Candidatus Giovannonibacteria bacterium GW2011_GWC2_43_8]KKT63548.1 MAG: 50S ribosomal protein L23 [Candidatus Giovannonibacteria bacterium GW2011_GWA2_44_26]
MPFNLSQIFGGWRKKKNKGRKAPESSPHSFRSRLTLPAERGGSDASHGPNEARSSKVATQTKNKSELAWKLIIAPHISEKSTMLGEGRYVFKVAGSANKPSLKQAIEARYGVTVLSINMLAARNKKRRRGVILGIKPGFKKAIVTLKAGQNITEF